MAMSTLLQAVPEQELHALKRDPDRIGLVNSDLSFTTHFADSINYFVAGDAYPTEQDHALWPMLHGEESVACPSLENGEFGVVTPGRARHLADLLAGLDIPGVAAQIEAADLAEIIDEEELYDLELIEPEEAATTIAGEIRRLIAFYDRVAAQQLGVVSYTT